MDIDFDKQFYCTVKAMRVTFSHPDVVRDKKWILKYIVCQGLFTLSPINIIYTIIYHDLKTLNFPRLCTNGIYILVYIVTTFQYIIMVYYQDMLKSIIATMRADFETSKQLSKDEQAIVLKYATKGKWITIQWFIIVACEFAFLVSRYIFTTVYYTLTDEFRFAWYIDLDYPDFVARNMDNVFVNVFLITGSQMYFNVYCSLIYTAFVPLGPLFMYHACGQLELLTNRIDALYNGRSRELVHEELKDIAKRLQFLCSFTNDIKSCFRVMYEVSMKGTAFMLPLALYQLIESIHRDNFSMELIAFIVGGTLISSTPCICSDLLMEKGEEVRMALYMCGWERETDRSIRSSLVIMLTRALRPTAIRTMFRTVCLDALTDLFHQAYAIYNLMNAMWK